MRRGARAALSPQERPVPTTPSAHGLCAATLEAHAPRVEEGLAAALATCRPAERTLVA